MSCGVLSEMSVHCVHVYSVSVTFTCRSSPNINSDELPPDDDIVAYNAGGYNREAHMRTSVGRETRAAKNGQHSGGRAWRSEGYAPDELNVGDVSQADAWMPHGRIGILLNLAWCLW